MTAIIEFPCGRKFSPEHQTKLQTCALPSDKSEIKFKEDGTLEHYWALFSVNLEDVIGLQPFTVHAALPAVNIPPPPAAHPPFNEKCQVAVPGLGLLLIEEVQVMLNACTEDLQLHLDRGWRILAICPQPDQRRPDYVLGRSKASGKPLKES